MVNGRQRHPPADRVLRIDTCLPRRGSTSTVGSSCRPSSTACPSRASGRRWARSSTTRSSTTFAVVAEPEAVPKEVLRALRRRDRPHLVLRPLLPVRSDRWSKVLAGFQGLTELTELTEQLSDLRRSLVYITRVGVGRPDSGCGTRCAGVLPDDVLGRLPGDDQDELLGRQRPPPARTRMATSSEDRRGSSSALVSATTTNRLAAPCRPPQMPMTRSRTYPRPARRQPRAAARSMSSGKTLRPPTMMMSLIRPHTTRSPSAW